MKTTMIRTAGDALLCTSVALSTLGLLACGGDTASPAAESTSTGDDDDDDDTATAPSTMTSPSTTTPADTSSGDEADSSSSDTGTQACADGEIGQILPAEVAASTFEQGDDFQGSCGGSGAPDVAFSFTAPETGTYTFDTVGSALDTVLLVLDGECSATELACDNNPISTTSVAVLDLAADQMVTLVVDGTSEFGSDLRLRVHAGDLACPAGDLGSTVPAMVSGDLGDFTDLSSSTCGGLGSPDAIYLFTAPADDTYVIDTTGSFIAPVVSVFAGGCGGAEIACAGTGLAVDLDMGETVAIAVDAGFDVGSFELHVSNFVGECPDADIVGALPQTIAGDLSDADNTTVGSCGGAIQVDDTYAFTSPADGVYRFDTAGSAIDTVLHLHEDSCSGAELACSDDLAFRMPSSASSAALAAGETVLVAVEGKSAGAYQLNVEQQECPDGPLSTIVPNTTLVTTFGGDDRFSASCANQFNSPSNDYVFTFVAPEAGVYTFDTQGTGFGTLVSGLAGLACVGDELGCANANEGSTTALALALDEGEEINLVVDGATGGGGAIQLNVNLLSGECPNDTLEGALPISASGTTVGGDNTSAGSCGGALRNDAAYEFTATDAGFHSFDTFGSAFDTVLYLRDGACDGAELACARPQNGGQARIGTELDAGQTVVVTVDGLVEGSYQLNVSAPTCPEEDLGSEFPLAFEGTTAASTDKLDFDASCFVSDQLSPEYTMSWTAPAAGSYTFDTVGSMVSSAVAVLSATCGGDTLGCASSFTNAHVELDAGQEVVVVVTGEFAASGEFTLNIN